MMSNPHPFYPPVPRSQIGPWANQALGLAYAEEPAAPGAGRPLPSTTTKHRPSRVELLSWELAAARTDAWTALVSRAMEANIFLEPGFALTAAQHFAPTRSPSFIFVSDASGCGECDRLIGLFALDVVGGFRTVTRGWLPNLLALGTPLLDRVQGAEALDCVLAWVEREHPEVACLLLPSLASEGPTAALIHCRARARGLEFRLLDRGARADLFSGTDIKTLLPQALSTKHVKELGRVHRRLAEMGELTYVSTRLPEQIHLAVERFIALEASGWKGRRGTAVACDPATEIFVRTMMRRLSHEAKCRLDSLEIDGKPIAMGIVLVSGKQAFLWKIAYDEAYSHFSPGVQFIIEFTRRQLIDDEITMTDSCAIPNHPMIDRLWPDKLSIADICLAISEARGKSFDAAVRHEVLRRK